MVSLLSPDPSQPPWALEHHCWAQEGLTNCVLFFYSLPFPSSLLEKVEQETWRETGISFVTSVTRLMERLLDYRYFLGYLPELFDKNSLSIKGIPMTLK